MIINYISSYIPDAVVPNKFFAQNFGINEQDILTKSGIVERRRCSSWENTNTMAIEAVKKVFFNSPVPLNDIDLIIGATYTPFDTVGTLAHAVQRQFNIANAKCFTVSSACSSFINALEIVDCYFANKKAKNALIIVSENNSIYNDCSDAKSAFLWGDGAAAVVISNERFSDDDLEVVDLNTRGLGNVGKNIEGVYLRPANGGLKMPFGKDVFQYACTYMVEEAEQLLQNNNLSISEIDYFIPHQANIRIIEYVAKKLKINQEQVLNNIEYFGNTGSASTPIILAQNQNLFKSGDKILITVFGGGYSSGSILLKK